MAVNIVASFKELANSDRLIQSVKEIVKSKVFYEDINNFFTVVPGIKGGQQVAAMRGIEYVTVADAGCGGASLNPAFPSISQKWNPKVASVKIKYCYTDFRNYFTQWALNNGYKIHDLTDVDFVKFITEFITDAMRADIQRMVLFSDQDILTNADLKDVAKAPFYTIFEKGLIPTLQYFKTIPSLAGNFIDLEQNDEADPYDIPNGYAVGLFGRLLKRARFTGTQILTNGDLYDNYEEYFTNLAGLQSSPDAIQNGLQKLKRKGKLIVPIEKYDEVRDRDFDDYLPHFALYADKSTLQVGVDDINSLEDITFEYIGGDDEHFYIKANYQIDFKMVNPYEFRAAI